jgi:signal transduction histidine kinase
MKYANELFFAVTSIILWGLVIGSKHLIPAKKIVQPESFWYIALISEAFCFTFFAIAPIVQIKLIALANIFLLGGYLYLAAYCRSLSNPITPQFKRLLLLALLLIGLIFEFLMQYGTFVQRVSFVIAVTNLCLVWQLIELKRLHKLSIELPTFLIVTIFGEIILATTRLILLFYLDPPSTIHLYDEPYLTTAVRWVWFAFTILSYVAIIGYALKKITIENTQALRENQKITELLKEKERLIYSLMKVNKTAATGALSASIAHELNQPLAASALNIEFLSAKLEKGLLNPEMGKKVLGSLDADIQRATTIVTALRSIFNDDDLNIKEVELGNLIVKALDIVKPELNSKDIQVQLRVDKDLLIKATPIEIEQVILNLFNNATDALANSEMQKRLITIDATKVGQSIHLSIADNGKGVPFEFKDQLFELLSSTKQTGMGLGLWLCKHIITRYGGTINYEDTIGSGAKFVITLPSAV